MHECIIGTTFTGRLIEETTVGPYPAVVPTISGQAWIYGLSSTCSIPPIPSPRASPSATSGAASVDVAGSTQMWFLPEPMLRFRHASS